MIGVSIGEKAKTSRHARLTIEKKVDAESYEKRSRGAATNDLLIEIRSIRALYMTGKADTHYTHSFLCHHHYTPQQAKQPDYDPINKKEWDQ